MPNSSDLREFSALAHELAEAAGAVQRRYFRRPVAVDSKVDDSPVTVADREAEAVMRDLIGRRFPSHGIFGEEFGRDRESAEFVWVLDPIDGTKSFITGRPLFGTLIALLREGRPVLGVIDQSILKERWVGIKGRPTLHNGSVLQTRECPVLSQASLYATSPLMFTSPIDRQGFDRVAKRARYPLFGGDCYAYGLVAMGFVDVVVEAGLQPYDYMALIPVIEGAGGHMSDWAGRDLDLASDGRVIASGDRRLHDEILALLDMRSAV
ncbi:inositol-phosphate phosphatase / L-galactose 1-phosphate phosphatase / histidinol-phosphatase [Arboricoccus pini]|uniref:Histidinol-phosphatase n=1 Tax=Arboricoccus pini TaxID=1963835 RepID=A0A212R4S8_9PROT|nr:histidinol-phosphatase [Arboricoccus pini]SNB67047.1 inositol-phosphate phosphatase / L-galactose 1-phosphate phosphatase / histidinol-phosphatase [Arboricoccus pini]